MFGLFIVVGILKIQLITIMININIETNHTGLQISSKRKMNIYKKEKCIKESREPDSNQRPKDDRHHYSYRGSVSEVFVTLFIFF